MEQGHLLTKSSFLQAIRCHKLLYLNAFHPDLGESFDDPTLRRLKEGQLVHKLARGLFPRGVEARAPDPLDLEASLSRTEELLDSGNDVLFEAAFSQDGVFAFVDILAREPDGWSMYEVKSATSVKDHYLWDVAIQVHLLRRRGMKVRGAYLVHVNGEYRRQGELDPVGIFTLAPVLEQCESLMSAIPAEIEEGKRVLTSGVMPEIDIGPYCDDPDECRFKLFCWRHVPEPSVFDVYYLGKDAKFDLYRQGVVDIDSIPDSYPMQARSRFHVQHHKRQAPHIDAKGLQRFLAGLEYPVHYFDFETFTTAIPPYDAVSPYLHIPFQFSLHVEPSKSAEPAHYGYLAQAGSDPRREVASQLLEVCEERGSIVVYYAGFERGVLQGLAEALPDMAGPLNDLESRLVDLRDPFAQRLLYLPAMGGSFSLKSVLPALVPGLSYSGLSVSDGMQAMEVFRQLEELENPLEIEKIRGDLWEYCKLDTLAMVEIVMSMRRIAKDQGYVAQLL
jgi:hypothetical protein